MKTCPWISEQGNRKSPYPIDLAHGLQKKVQAVINYNGCVISPVNQYVTWRCDLTLRCLVLLSYNFYRIFEMLIANICSIVCFHFCVLSVETTYEKEQLRKLKKNEAEWFGNFVALYL